MIFAAIEIAIYAASLTGALAAFPFCIWLLGLSEPNALVMAMIAAPFVMWALGIVHWRMFEHARPTINATIYRTAWYLWRARNLCKKTIRHYTAVPSYAHFLESN